jgi:acyl carrier protein
MKKRLISCFKQVFPKLSDKEIVSASEDTMETWTSITVISLIAAIEIEFEIEVDFDNIDTLTSFSAFLAYISV